jgi:uncharacterized protein YerC
LISEQYQGMEEEKRILRFLKKIPTFSELEKEAGITPQTISKVIRGERHFSESQRQKLIPVLKK